MDVISKCIQRNCASHILTQLASSRSYTHDRPSASAFAGARIDPSFHSRPRAYPLAREGRRTGEDCPKFMAHKLIRVARARAFMTSGTVARVRPRTRALRTRAKSSRLSPSPLNSPTHPPFLPVYIYVSPPSPLPPLAVVASSAAARFPPYLIKSDLHAFPMRRPLLS